MKIFELFGNVTLKDGDVQRKLDELDGKAEKTGGKLATMSDKFSNAGKKMSSAGGKLSKKVTLPIVALGGVAIKSAMDFESGMSKVASLSGATGADLQKLEDKAREMGKSTIFSATEAAEGLEYLALAGWDTEQMTAGLEPALLLAGAAGLELGESADIMTDTMSMFGMEAEEATKMTDMLAYAQANSNTDVRGLGEALKYAGAGANAMGYDLADTSALLGTFADQGLKGSAAGTTLNAMFTDMKNKSKDGAIQIGETSVAIVDSNGKYRDMADIMADTEKATEGMSDAQKDQALSSVFGTQAIKGVNMVMEAGTDKLKDFEDGIRNSDGASKEMYETMNDNLKGSLEGMKSALSEAAISMGDVLVPAIKKGAEWVTKVTDKFNGLDDGTKKTIVVIGLIVASIGPLLLVFGKLAMGISAIMKLAPILTAAIGGITAPMIGVVAGIAAVIVAGVALYKNWDTVKEHAVKFWNKIKEMKDKVVVYFTELKDKSVEKIIELKDKTIMWIIDLKDKTVAKVIEMKDKVVKWFKDLKDKAIGIVKELLRRNIEFYGNLVTGVVNKVKEMYTNVVKWFANLKTSAIEKVNQLKKSAVDRVTEMKNNVVNGVKSMKTGVVTWFTNMKTDAIQKAKDMVDYIKKMPGKMADGFRAGRNALKNAFVSVFNTVLRAVGKPINGIIKGANWVLGKFNAPKINLWDVPQYAKGTDGHLGGPALVNDQKGSVYREMIQTPDGETFIPKGRNVLFPKMPKGTAVLPAKETKRVMAYKKGVGIIQGLKNIGSKAWNGLKSGVGSIWDFVKKPLDLVSNLIQDNVSLKGITKVPLNMAKGIVGKGKDAMVGWVKDLFKNNEDPDNITGGSGGMGSTMMGGLGFRGFSKSSPFGYRTHPILGYRKLHTGVDLAAPSGTNVFAQHAGRVLHSGWMGSYGKMVKIGQGITQQIYAHLSRNIAKLGSNVKQGQLIGKVGSTGGSTGPHLHYEVRRNGRPVHPGYSDGTWSDKEHLANISEGNKLEAVIPMTKPRIAKPMLEQASGMLGMNDSKEILQVLGLILQAIREGHSINIDGKEVFNTASPYMAMAMKRRR